MLGYWIQIVGELAALLARIKVRKALQKVPTEAQLVNHNGKRLIGSALRAQFDKARDATCATAPALSKDITDFRFYDLRAKGIGRHGGWSRAGGGARFTRP